MDKEQDRLVSLAEITIQPTELAYVTSFDLERGTFFVQQCKHTNQSLVIHNSLIHEYCEQNKELKPSSVKVGDILCARFAADNAWYRGVVKQIDEGRRECTLCYIDYGNSMTVSIDELVEVSPQQVPTIEKSPFGFHCTLEGSENLNAAETNRLLSCLIDEYILFKVKERLDSDHWQITLPKVAYNTTFWTSFQKGAQPDNKTNQVAASVKVDDG